MTKEYVKCLAPFGGVTVGKVYEIVGCVDPLDGFHIINDRGERDVWWLVPGEFELVTSPLVEKEKREMKFSDKVGSAVVHYKSGQTFHITRLTYMAIVGTKVLVTREYEKDGIEFTQSVYIPFEKFDKVVFQSEREPYEIQLGKDNLLQFKQTVKKSQIYFN